MKKLGIACALLLTCGAAIAGTDGMSGIGLPVTNVTVAPNGTLSVPLKQLYPNKNYQVICLIQDPNYLVNQVLVGPSYTGGSFSPVTYNLDGNFFSNAWPCSKTSENNLLVATGVQNASVGPASTLNIGNMDQSDSIVVENCIASPVIGAH